MMFGYCRVSTNDQKTSLQEQERVIRGMAMAQGITQYDLQIFTDEDVSGGMPLSRRPAGRELFDLVKKGDVVCASKLDRVFRDALDALFTYKSFKERGVDLILFDMGIEPVTRDGMSKVFFTMLCAFAELERNRIGERMQLGKKIKRDKGGYAGGKVPLGMRVVGEGREAMLVPDDNEQRLIKFLHSNEVKWLRLGAVVRRVNAAGFRTRTGRPFERKSIWRMLPKDALCKTKPMKGRACFEQRLEEPVHAAL